MSLIKISSSKGLYQVLGGGLLAEAITTSRLTGNATIDTSLGFHLHLSSANAAHKATLSAPTTVGQLLLITNAGGGGDTDLVLEAAALSLDSANDATGEWDLPKGDSVLLVATSDLKWSPTSQSLQ